MDVRADAKREGLPVEVLDDWRIMPAIALIQPLALDRGYLFWPATGYWRRSSHGGGGKLIEEMRRASSWPAERQMRCFSATALQSGNLFPGLQCPPRPDRKATSRHGETQHPDYTKTYWRNQRGPYAYRAVLHRPLKSLPAGAGL